MYSSVPSIALVYFCCSINLHRTRLLYYWWILCPSSYSVPKECIIHGLWLRFSFVEKVFYRGSIMQLIEMFPIFFLSIWIFLEHLAHLYIICFFHEIAMKIMGTPKKPTKNPSCFGIFKKKQSGLPTIICINLNS